MMGGRCCGCSGWCGGEIGEWGRGVVRASGEDGNCVNRRGRGGHGEHKSQRDHMIAGRARRKPSCDARLVGLRLPRLPER